MKAEGAAAECARTTTSATSRAACRRAPIACSSRVRYQRRRHRSTLSDLLTLARASDGPTWPASKKIRVDGFRVEMERSCAALHGSSSFEISSRTRGHGLA
eukprot:scaffold368_cov258-Pinguiococcus_pyrenoidosus.AAC.48